MQELASPGRSDIAALVVSSLQDVLSQRVGRSLDGVGEATNLIGREAALDSMGLIWAIPR